MNITLTYVGEQEKTIKELIEKVGGTDELFKRALAMFSVILEHQEQGGEVIFHHKDGREETIKDVLDC